MFLFFSFSIYSCGQNIWGELGIENKTQRNAFKDMILPPQNRREWKEAFNIMYFAIMNANIWYCLLFQYHR